ncbi:hypothetical protein PPERSA_05256 [Pseudocohnilembus persalinus]|uniref:Uncharacterized protein n=1 Tax=Pseudocohnilembus persalinus TaxID=266149 RepID=A0A0V0QY20_PSEPJ|nr:hypothetical protein PPERSA_05256 [Pseudocohnilembus persalinus]|eukprot:KRX07092.1 hypothetical protein PPERSA_05256 [Pseudocohnilembus persalinus]
MEEIDFELLEQIIQNSNNNEEKSENTEHITGQNSQILQLIQSDQYSIFTSLMSFIQIQQNIETNKDKQPLQLAALSKNQGKILKIDQNYFPNLIVRGDTILELFNFND